MKKITTISICACMAIAAGSFTSCKKNNNNNNTTPTTPTTSSTTPPTPTPSGVDGALVSLLMNVTTVTAGFPVTVSTGTALAVFYSPAGSTTMVDGGAVSVNGFSLTKQSNNSYIKTIEAGMTTMDLNFSTDNSNWSVGGAGSVPAFTYNHSVTFPEFTGTVPDSVVRSAGVTIALTGKVNAADSVLLFIAAGSKSITRTVAGSASSVTISASDLSGWSAVSDKSAVLEVVPYKVTMSAQGGKNYAFIKEYAAVKNINIL